MPEFDYNAALSETPEGVWAGTDTCKVFYVRTGATFVAIGNVVESGGTWAVMTLWESTSDLPEDVRDDFENVITLPRRTSYLDFEPDFMDVWARHGEYFTHAPDFFSENYRPQ